MSVVESEPHPIELNLVSPNILETDRAARESLEALKAIFQQDEVTVKLVSKQGSLNANKPLLEQYLRYIAEGEGWWRLVVSKARRVAKKIYTSRTQVKSITAEMPQLPELDLRNPEEKRADEERALIDAAQRFASGTE